MCVMGWPRRLAEEQVTRELLCLDSERKPLLRSSGGVFPDRRLWHVRTWRGTSLLRLSRSSLSGCGQGDASSH